MKITLDLTSVVVGGSVALALGVVAGFSPQATSVPAAANAAPRQITGQFSPHPSDFVSLEALRDGTGLLSSYDSSLLTIPAGRILVLTGVTKGVVSSSPVNVNLEIDGLLKLLRYGNSGQGPSAMFPTGIVLTEGQTVRLLRPDISSYQWLHGYWADA